MAVQPRTAGFPVGTLAVNIIGCFLIGIVFGLFDRGQISHEWRIILATGFLGGFTTFSAFSNESFMLLRDGHAPLAFAYIAASVILGLSATYLAYLLVK
jgi:CrcB protein